MKLEELQQYAWKRLGVRKHIAGRKAVDDLVEIAVQNWEPEYLRRIDHQDSLAVFESEMLANMKRVYQAGGDYGNAEYGFIWVFILSSIASALIKILIEWWLSRRENRDAMDFMRAELNK